MRSHCRWDVVLPALRADALDCVQTTLALFADQFHGAGTHLELGCRCRFPARRGDRVVHVQPSLQDRLDDASELLGLRIGEPLGPMDGPALRRHLASAGTLDVVADAHDLPWVPYAGRRHMPHSFLLEAGDDGAVVVDAYHNDTPWGPARPGAWCLSAADLDRAVGAGALAITVETDVLQAADRAARLADNAARARAAGPDIDRYIVLLGAGLDGPEAVERLVLDIWLLARERLLHAAWLGDHPAAAAIAGGAEAWQQLATRSYLALRRVQRGAPPHGTIVDDLGRLLHADAALVARLAG